MNLTTIANVKRLLEESGGLDPEVEALIEAKIAEVSERAAQFCNRGFEKIERVSYHNGGGRYLFLTALPVAEIDEILWAADWDWTGATEYTSDEYALLSGGMVGYKFGLWPAGDKSIRVTYTGGYDEAENFSDAEYVPIPDDLEGAICRQVVYEWRRRNDPGLSSVSLPDGTINKMQVDEWLTDVEKTLRRYRIRPG